MYKYTKDGVSVTSVLDTRRIKNNGRYPVKIQVIYKRIQKYFGTGKELQLDEWQRLPRTRSCYLQEVRRDIISSFDLIKQEVQSLTERGEFSFEELCRRLGRGRDEMLHTTFKRRIDHLRAEQRIGNMLWYTNVYKSIQRFAPRPIPLSEITVSWLERYDKFLRAERKSPVTISMHFRAIRAILNEARKNGTLKETQYPFGKGKFEIQDGEGRKIALNIHQIEQIAHYAEGSRTSLYFRDLWFFIYLCNGINVADLVKLKYANIIDGEICFVRQKTEHTSRKRHEIRAVMTPEMYTILHRWGNPVAPDNYLFPVLDGSESPLQQKIKTQNLTRRINWHMHIIGQKLGIGHISTYTARHSFATILKHSGANIMYISESLGHSDLRATACYLAAFEKEERQKNAHLLTNFAGTSTPSGS